MQLAVLIPTYNEFINIGILLTRLRHEARTYPDIFFQIYVIDDSSPDQTAEVVNDHIKKDQTENFQIKLITRPKKEGLGKAYTHAFSFLLSLHNPPDFVLQMDADLSHDPKYLSQFISAIVQGSDLVVGSRYLEGGGTPNWIWYRKLLSQTGNLYARLILGQVISDYTGGFNMYSMALLKKMDLNQINYEGYGFLISFKYEAIYFATHITQVPIQFQDRIHGSSKMPIGTIVKNFCLVLTIKIRRLQKRLQ